MTLMNIPIGTPIVKWTATLAFAFLALPAAAHPGHGPLEHGLAHPLTSPYHIVVMLLLGTVLLMAARVVRRFPLRRAVNWTGCGALAVAALLWGLRNPMW